MSGAGRAVPPEYRPRARADSVWRRLVREHLSSFLEVSRDGDDPTSGVPSFVERELQAFLSCGDPDAGFLRLRCPDCKHSVFLPFTCAGRAVCPSCGARRMAQVAAKLRPLVVPTPEVEIGPLSSAPILKSAEAPPLGAPSRTRARWATLIHRVYGADALACPRCGGQLRAIAHITDPLAIRRIDEHLRAEIRPPARAPP